MSKKSSCQLRISSANLISQLNVAEVVFRENNTGEPNSGAHPIVSEEDFFAFSPSANLVGVIEGGHAPIVCKKAVKCCFTAFSFIESGAESLTKIMN